jgi:hypothetical protein
MGAGALFFWNFALRNYFLGIVGCLCFLPLASVEAFIDVEGDMSPMQIVSLYFHHQVAP